VWSKLLSNPSIFLTAFCKRNKTSLCPQPKDLVLREVEIEWLVGDGDGCCAINDCRKVLKIEVQNSRAELVSVSPSKASFF
jgi:hypothetical protein